MFYWIEHHGLEFAVICWVVALTFSCMPAIPPNSGWWTRYLWNICQVFSASLHNLARNSPYGQKFEAVESASRTVQPDGAVIEQRTSATASTLPADEAGH